jgi:hypothetical protein
MVTTIILINSDYHHVLHCREYVLSHCSLMSVAQAFRNATAVAAVTATPTQRVSLRGGTLGHNNIISNIKEGQTVVHVAH